MLSETAILREGFDALQRLLPPGWSCSSVAEPRGSDLQVAIRSPDDTVAEMLVEAKRRVPLGSIPKVRAALSRAPAVTPLLVAGWLSPLSRAELRAIGINYVDLTGNVDLRLSRPGLYIRTSGADRDPEPASSTLASLKGAGAARAVRALADFMPPYGVRQLAEASGASAPVLSRVLALVEREGLVTRGTRGAVETVAWANVLRRWGEDYGFQRSHRAVPCLEPRGISALTRKLLTSSESWAATGTMGVPPGVAVVPVQLATVYVESPERSAAALGLKIVEFGANVVLVEPADAGVYARSSRGDDGIVRCAPSQVYADLLTGPGRGSAEAAALMEWMEANESAWRRRA
jgi:hypothetical protein